jgi:hypothetical protein
MSFKNCWMISSSYNFQVHQQRSQRRCCFSQTAILWFEVLPDMSPALPGFSPALPGAPRLVSGPPSYSECRQECPSRVWYFPEIDTSKFTLHILSDTPGRFQWIKYILLMNTVPAALQKWVSTERQWFWVVHIAYSIECIDLQAHNGFLARIVVQIYNISKETHRI